MPARSACIFASVSAKMEPIELEISLKFEFLVQESSNAWRVTWAKSSGPTPTGQAAAPLSVNVKFYEIQVSNARRLQNFFTTYGMNCFQIHIHMCKCISNATTDLCIRSNLLNSFVGEINAWSQHSIKAWQWSKGSFTLNVTPTTRKKKSFFYSLQHIILSIVILLIKL